MRKLPIIILTIALGLLLVAARNAGAQTNETLLDKVLRDFGGMPTNYAVEAYGTYAPKAPSKYGGGMLAIWNVNAASDSLIKVGVALGLDWLGEFSLVSGNVTLSAPFHPLPLYFPTLTATPIVLGGIATPYSGDGKFNGDQVIVSDVGGEISFGHAFGGRFTLGAVWGKWIGSGPYDVPRYHLNFGWSHGI